LGLRAFGIEQGLWAGPIVLGAIALGQSVLVIPAGTGLYYFVTSWTARALGASAEQAAAYAVLTHLGTILTQMGMGAVSLWVRGIRWKDLKRSEQSAKSEEGRVDEGYRVAHAVNGSR
jgi:hypothetical protein